MSLIDFTERHHDNPLEVVERVASTNGWSFERAGEDEITILVTGKWTDYQVSYTWMFDIEALHLACAFEFKVPERCRGEVQQLISLINEQMWVGHFDLWSQDGLIMYRHALVLAGGVERLVDMSPHGVVSPQVAKKSQDREDSVNEAGGTFGGAVCRVGRPNRTGSTPTLRWRCGRWLRRSGWRPRGCGCCARR